MDQYYPKEYQYIHHDRDDIVHAVIQEHEVIHVELHHEDLGNMGSMLHQVVPNDLVENQCLNHKLVTGDKNFKILKKKG